MLFPRLAHIDEHAVMFLSDPPNTCRILVIPLHPVGMGHVIRTEHDFCRGGFPHFPDDGFVVFQVAIDVEDQQVGVERIQIVLSGTPQGWRLEAANGAVLDLQVCLRKPFLQIRHDMISPALRGD